MSDGKSQALSRIESILDDASFVELQALVTARSTDFGESEQAPSDGVVIGHGQIDGDLVFIYAQDPSVKNGSIGEMHAKKILSVYDMARKVGAPVIGLLDSSSTPLIQFPETPRRSAIRLLLSFRQSPQALSMITVQRLRWRKLSAA